MAVTPHRLAAALFLSTTALTTVPAYAGPGAEDRARAWLDSLVPPGGAVEVGSTTYDPATSTVTFGDVSIEAGTGGLASASFGSIVITDPRQTVSGAFAADRLAATAARIEVQIPDPAAPAPGPKGPPTGAPPIGTAIITMDEWSVEQPVVPLVPPAPRGGSPTAWIAYLSDLVETASMGEVSVTNAIVSTEGMPEGDSTTTYGYMRLSGLVGGRMEWAEYGDYEQRAPFPPPEGGPPMEMIIRLDEYSSNAFDLGAALETLDPAAYEGGVGDNEWRNVNLDGIAEGLEVEIGGVVTRIGSSEMLGFRMRQTPEPLLNLVEELIRNPQAMENDPFNFGARLLQNAAALAAVEYLDAEDISVSAEGFGSLSIGRASLNAVDGNGIGAIRIEDFAYEGGEGVGSGSFEEFAIQGIVYGSFIPLLEQLEQNPLGQPAIEIVLAAIPQVSWVALDAFSITAPGQQAPATVAGIEFAASDFVGGIARRSSISFRGVNVPTALIEDATVRQPIEDLGFTEIVADLVMVTDWDSESGLYEFEDVTLTVENAGTISLTALLGGLPMSVMADPYSMQLGIVPGDFRSGAVTFGNGGIVERLLTYYAEANNTDEATLRNQVAGIVSLGLSGQPELQPVIGAAITAFMDDPQSFHLSAAPPSPVLFSEFQNLGGGDPLAAAEALNLGAVANE